MSRRSDVADALAAALDRNATLTAALVALIARIDRCGGYADHDEQQALWVAKGLLR